MLDTLRAGKPLRERFDAPASVWQFGSDLTLIGICGEVARGYVLTTQNAIGHRNPWIASYCHDYYGKLPTSQIVRVGGYETRGLSNGLDWFDEAAENDKAQTIAHLAS